MAGLLLGTRLLSSIITELWFDWPFKKKLPSNFNKILFSINVFEDAVCKMLTTWFPPQYFKWFRGEGKKGRFVGMLDMIEKEWRHLLSGWRHHMETFPAPLDLCEGNPPVTGKFSSQRPVTRSFGVSLICAWINGWANHRAAGELRRRRAHYDVTLMYAPKQPTDERLNCTRQIY